MSAGVTSPGDSDGIGLGGIGPSGDSASGDSASGDFASGAPIRGLLGGWGRSPVTGARVALPRTPDEAGAAWSAALAAPGPLVARGLGRAYGDAAQCAGGTVVDMTACNRIIAADLSCGVLRAEAGLSLDSLLRWSVPRGWFVPVSPGTRFVTLGGAMAADIHGKNHHREGSFASAVKALTLLAPTGARHVTPEGDEQVFWATAGGMGLTGLMLDLTIQLVPIQTSQMLVDTERATDLDECMSLMAESDHRYRYSVAWVDCLARGAKLGRAVLTRGDHAAVADLPARPRRGGASPASPLRFDPRQLLRVPLTPPLRPLTPLSIAMFNEAWYRHAPRRRLGEVQGIAPFFHPLDGVAGWNRLYGPAGFTQYQCVVPFGSEDVIRRVIEELSSRRLASFLAVLKRFGPGNPGPLSFPAPGWTLALDLPLGLPELGAVMDGFDDMVASSGGRVYLAKDARVRPSVLRAMYPRLGEWQAVRGELDPSGRLSSNLARRLDLVEVQGRPEGAT